MAAQALVLAAAALLFAAVMRKAQRWAAKARARRLLARLELRPNALLTRRPIAFVGGARSVFWNVEHWGFAPRFLAEHGYACAAFDLPWRSPQARATALRRALAEGDESYHLIFDAGERALAEEAAAWRLPQIASITVAKSAKRRAGGSRATSALAAGTAAPRASAADLSPLSANNVYTLELSPPGRRASTLSGRALRAALAAHRAWAAALSAARALGGRPPSFEAPRAEEIALYDESLRLERRLLAHAISLAESELE